jgi:hypothetical protein
VLPGIAAVDHSAARTYRAATHVFSAGLTIPLVDEVAADISMGSSPKILGIGKESGRAS